MCEEQLSAIGWLLDQQRVRDAFISVGAADVTVTPVRAGVPRSAIVYRLGDLPRLVPLERLRAETHRPVAPGDREGLLRLVGRELARQGCRAAFIVLYDEAVIVDCDDPTGAGSLVFTRETLRQRTGELALRSAG
jgi:hypothetical protein